MVKGGDKITEGERSYHYKAPHHHQILTNSTLRDTWFLVLLDSLCLVIKVASMGHSHMDDVALNYVANESLNHSLKDAYAHLFV